jgi:hypothetical protein
MPGLIVLVLLTNSRQTVPVAPSSLVTDTRTVSRPQLGALLRIVYNNCVRSLGSTLIEPVSVPPATLRIELVVPQLLSCKRCCFC